MPSTRSTLETDIAVTITDLDLIRAALNAAYHHNTVIDLAEQYRKLQQRPAPSHLTKSLQTAATIVDAYIELHSVEAEAAGADG